MKFKEFINPGAFQNTGTTGFDNNFFGAGHSLDMPMPTLNMPTKVIQATVRKIMYTSNPITVILTDGTVWKLSKRQWDYLKSHNKEIRINSKVQIEIYLDGTVKGINVL